jgi:predicted membrane protein
LTAFTIQRFLVVKWPMTSKFKKKSFAWRITFSIIIVSMTINLWALFSFKLKQVDSDQLCDIDTDLIEIYYYISIFYILLSMLVPMMIILVFNILIINKTSKDDKKRKLLQSDSALNKTYISSDYKIIRRNAIRNTKILKNFKKPNKSRKITFSLLLASFSYVLLNLPYFITW